MVSTVRKSQASMLAACARKKARHDECIRCGAGWFRASSSTSRTEVAETAIPRPLSSPTIRLYPQCGFSPARRRMSSRSERSSGGRPGLRFGYVQRRAMSWRCQRSSVSGLNEKLAHAVWWSERLSDASSARSARVSFGREPCRRRIASSWRRTRISNSFERRGRPSSHTSANRFRTARYANDQSNQPSLDHGKSAEPSEPDNSTEPRTSLRTLRPSLTNPAPLAAKGVPARGVRDRHRCPRRGPQEAAYLQGKRRGVRGPCPLGAAMGSSAFLLIARSTAATGAWPAPTARPGRQRREFARDPVRIVVELRQEQFQALSERCWPCVASADYPHRWRCAL